MVERGEGGSAKIKDSVEKMRSFVGRHKRGLFIGIPSIPTAGALFIDSKPWFGGGVWALGYASFIRDSRINELHGKLTTNISDIVATKDAEQFTLLPTNEGADFLEQRFGITFPAEHGRPSVVVFDKDNWRERMKLERYSNKTYHDGEYFPEYSPRYHAILMSQKNSLKDLEEMKVRDILFANMNAYVAANNPDLMTTLEHFDIARRLVGYGQKIPEFDAERFVTSQCFAEGIIRYSSNIAADRLQLEIRGERVLKPAVPLRANLRVKEGRATVDDMLEFFDMLKGYQNELHDAFHGKGFSRTRARKARTLKNGSTWFTYNIGAYFVMEAADELVRMGLGHRAYDLLVKTPPTTIADLTNPQNFVQEHFRRERGR